MGTHRDRQLVTRSSAPTFVEASRLLLGFGSLFFAVWGLADPEGLARAMGDDPKHARALGVRDGLIGAALLASRGPAAMTARVAADIADAVRLRSSSPKVAAGAAAFAAWGVAALALSGTQRG